MRCYNCLRIGHTAKYCKSSSTCLKCSRTSHINVEIGEVCEKNQSCINCRGKNTQTDNLSRDRKCQVFITYQESLAIKTLQKVDNRQAWSIYKTRHHRVFVTGQIHPKPTNTSEKDPKSSQSVSNINLGTTNNKQGSTHAI